MAKKIAVAFQTCDRFHYTKTTVESFIRLNDLRHFDIYYGDDASTDMQVHKFMKRKGVKTAIVNKERRGCGWTCATMLRRVAELSNADYLLYVQNDCETKRPIPVDMVHKVFNSYPHIGIFRLFGVWKDGDVAKRKAVTEHKGDPKKRKMSWIPLEIKGVEEELEFGKAHWMFLPSIIKTELALKWLKSARTERQMYVSQWNSDPDVLTVRSKGKNFLSHLGPKEDRTPGFVS